MALAVLLALGSASGPQECADPPSRAADSYWTYIDACGCAKLDPPSRASNDYDRFLKACSAWRERNPSVNAVVSGGKSQPSAAATSPRECADPPSRAADGYWTYIDACGCAKLDTPSKASNDYDRYLKACSAWRERNPQANVSVAKP